jgi:hypothetical protein
MRRNGIIPFEQVRSMIDIDGETLLFIPPTNFSFLDTSLTLYFKAQHSFFILKIYSVLCKLIFYYHF